jgi:PAS domain S-box-containing protein
MNPFLQKIISDPDIKLLLNSIYDGVYIVNTEREILFWNDAAEKITGHLNADVLMHKCSDNILNHIDADGNLLCSGNCPLVECMLNDKNTEKKIFPLSKDKKRFPIQTRVGPIKDPDGNIVGAIEVFRDISEQEDLRILQEKFNDLIRKYVSKTTYQEIVNQAKMGTPARAQLRDLTILYIDVAAFTSFAEKNSLEETAIMLNDVFGVCEVITKKYHGDIDKFIGDAIMATFVDANDAVDAAFDIFKHLEIVNEERTKSGREAIGLHMGINSGNVIQAELGTPERKDITIVGDAVNIAARIEEMSEPGSVYISESTFSRLKNSDDFAFYKKLAVKGRKEPILVFKAL